MVDIKTKKDLEIENLAANLRKNKLASSESEAKRMAEEMLSTGKKVSEDFAEREKKIYGGEKKDAEVDLAHKHMEQLSANIARGKSDVRIDVEGVDVNQPLKDIVKEEPEPEVNDDDEVAVEISEEPEVDDEVADIFEVKEETEPATESKQDSELAAESQEPELVSEPDEVVVEEPDVEVVEEEPAEEEPEPEEEPEAAPEEEVSVVEEPEDEPEEEPAEEEPAEEVKEEPEEEPDVEIKELGDKEKPDKSDEERKKEIESMPESKVDLADVFGVKK